MKTYSTYKLSGIEWIGEIPNHWQLLRVKDIGKVVLGKMLNNTAQDDYKYKHYLKSKNVNWLNVNVNSVEEMYFSKHELKQYRIRKDDLLLSEGGEVGKTCIWNDEIEECYIQNSVHKISLFKDKNPRYYMYLSFSLGSSKYYDKIVNQVSIKHLTWEKLIKVIWLVPPFEEQVSIAKYLDTKIQAIDKKIDLLSKKADSYKDLRKSLINETVCRGLDKNVILKDSDIEWIGQIPEHWKIARIKDFTYVRARIGWQGLRNDEFIENGNWYCVTGTDFSNGTIDWENCYYVEKERYDQDTKIQLKINDLLITKDGTIGKIALIIELPKQATLNSGVFVTRPLLKKYSNEFLFWFLQSTSFKNFIDYTKNGSTILHLYQNVFERFSYCLPDLEEQKLIAKYLDEKTQKIDAILLNIQKQIDALKELRKTLINDVVTGKIKVTNN